jgi:hypothetical protein
MNTDASAPCPVGCAIANALRQVDGCGKQQDLSCCRGCIISREMLQRWYVLGTRMRDAGVQGMLARIRGALTFTRRTSATKETSCFEPREQQCTTVMQLNVPPVGAGRVGS